MAQLQKVARLQEAEPREELVLLAAADVVADASNVVRTSAAK